VPVHLRQARRQLGLRAADKAQLSRPATPAVALDDAVAGGP